MTALADLHTAVSAVVAQDARIDARFREWFTGDRDKGGAIAQRNMERKRDRLSYVVTDAIWADTLKAELGEDAWGELVATWECSGPGPELLTAIDQLKVTS